MKIILISLVSTMVSMAAIDAVWLKIMFSKFYQPNIGHLLADSPKLLPGAIFYILFAAALALFVILPAFNGEYSLLKTALYGTAFGLITYATYDLTNHATMKNWPVIVSVVDIVWGALLTAVVSVCTISIIRFFS